jgi:hypothetical protein
MRKTIFIFIFLAILSASCEKEETSMPVNLYAPVIHGYFQTNGYGDKIRMVGSYDMKISVPSLNSSPKSICINSFPNPCNKFIIVYIGGAGILKKIWIVPANYSNGSASLLNANFLSVQGQPVFSYETTEDGLEIDMSRYKYKYYRVYVKIDDILLWDNIVKQ